MNDQSLILESALEIGKFQDPDLTAKGEHRASVPLMKLTTLWFNTGTLCNIECANCYIESSPTNDRLVYLTKADVEGYLNQIRDQGLPTQEIGLTGGEPFMNPDMVDMARLSLERGFEVLILTNAMRPMMRKHMQKGLLALQQEFGHKLTLRVSLDHFDKQYHDEERGVGSYDLTIKGMEWLRDNGFSMAIAGRSLWGHDEAEQRQGYATLFAKHGFDIDATNPVQTVVFPEMDEQAEVPEITTACWGILNKSPRDVMCASSRMVVRRRGATTPTVLACTLLPYDPQFELGDTLEQAAQPVKLNHPHCAKFCVLGGASCSA
jgi:hypothetical protein